MNTKYVVYVKGMVDSKHETEESAMERGDALLDLGIPNLIAKETVSEGVDALNRIYGL